MRICPRCQASGDEPCRTAGGNVATSTHVDRLRVVRVPGALELALVESVDRAYWLTPLYAPTIDAAQLIARKIDDAVWIAELKATGTLFDDHALGNLEGGIVYDVQTLHTLLTSLGLNPKGRAELKLDDQDESDDLAAVLELYEQ